jgi:hypothetical protein
MKLACDIALMAGNFASQPLAFAHLLDAAEAQGIGLDLDHVEVVQAAQAARLAQWFTPEIHARIPEAPTLIAFLPASGGPLAATDHLTPLGAFPAQITRAPLPRD